MSFDSPQVPNPSPSPSRPRHSHRFRAGVAAAVVLTLVATGCQVGKVGRRCSQTWGRDSGNVLQCKKGRWVRVMTFKQYLILLDTINKQNAAKAAADAAAVAAAKAAAEAAAQAESCPTAAAGDPNRPANVSERAWAIRGTGTWVDVYDWSPTWTNFKKAGSTPGWNLSKIDRMADNGISTLYIQTAKAELADPVLDRDLLVSIIAKARTRGIRVIGWYLPTFADPAADQAHVAATIDLGVDGFGMDIESTATPLAVRNQRLIDLSHWVRATYPNVPLGGIVLPPVVTDVINLNYWPSFPWTQISGDYDVWMPMGYWTNRKAESGWRHGHKYTAENIDRVRANLGQPNAVVHPIGGLSDTATSAQIGCFVLAAAERGAIGGSLYDDMISTVEQYGQLAPLAKP